MDTEKKQNPLAMLGGTWNICHMVMLNRSFETAPLRTDDSHVFVKQSSTIQSLKRVRIITYLLIFRIDFLILLYLFCRTLESLTGI